MKVLRTFIIVISEENYALSFADYSLSVRPQEKTLKYSKTKTLKATKKLPASNFNLKYTDSMFLKQTKSTNKYKTSPNEKQRPPPTVH